MALAAPARAAWPDDVSIVEWYASSLADIVQRAKKTADAKRDANAAIEAARAKFFADRKAGISDTESLREYELQLLAKDIYYLTPYLYEGMTPAAIKQFKPLRRRQGGLWTAVCLHGRSPDLRLGSQWFALPCMRRCPENFGCPVKTS
jgi:hypothetical protein